MNSLKNYYLLFILFIIVCSLGSALAFFKGLYGLSIACMLVLLYIAYKLYKLNMRSTLQFKLFVESIRFSDNNVSFNNTLKDSVYSEYCNNMNTSILKLNSLAQKRESDINFYINLLNRVDFALVVIDEQGDITWINRMAIDMLGNPNSKNIKSLESISDNLLEVFMSLQPRGLKTIKIHRNGKTINVAINLSAISIRGKNYKIYSIKDVKPIVEDTENQAWQQLIRVLTHEMMNSLTPIISLSDTFSAADTKYDQEDIIKAMSAIHRRSKGLVDFVNNYKKIAQISPPKKESVLVKELIGNIISLFATQDLRIDYILTSDQLTIEADRSQIEQVLINLVKNAWEASIERSNPKVKISAMQQNESVVVSVSDNGVGISNEIVEQIFMPFYTTKSNGSGIGLSICRQIINLHGGTLTVSSLPDGGSIFTIRLE